MKFDYLRGDYMSAKEYLMKIRTIDMLIDTKIEQVKMLRDRLTSIGSPIVGDKVQCSPDPDKFTNTIAKIIELEEEINRDIDRLVDYKREVRGIIEQMTEDIEKIILYKHYFEGKSFEQIAVDCNYSWRWIISLHGSALKNFEKVQRQHITS